MTLKGTQAALEKIYWKLFYYFKKLEGFGGIWQTV